VHLHHAPMPSSSPFLSDYKFIWNSRHPHTCYISCPFHSPLYECLNNIW
jgi:hypothetical protein